MKVITEEYLKNKYAEVKQAYLECDQSHMYAESRAIAVIEELMQECQEIDTLTVSQLRHMAEKPIIPEGKLQIFVMVYLNYTDVPVIISYDTREKWPDEAYHGVGWVYLPLHKPEKE